MIFSTKSKNYIDYFWFVQQFLLKIWFTLMISYGFLAKFWAEILICFDYFLNFVA